jgi:hypothetical protein
MRTDRTRSRRARAAALLAAPLAWTSAFAVDPPPTTPFPTSPAHAGPCPVSEAPPCTLVLAGPGAPSASAACASDAWSALVTFKQPERWSDPDGDGSWESVLEITLDPARDCGCARLRAFYGDEVRGWTFHVGNSPTNNGHGGDEGTTALSAELQLFERQLAVYTVAQAGHRSVDRLLEATVPSLAGRILDVEVCNQFVRVQVRTSLADPAPLTWKLETLSSRLLFSLGPDDPRKIWVGLNRVVHLANGPASHGRTGAGVRRVELTLSP